MSLATSMGPGCCHDLGTTWLRGEHGGLVLLVSTDEPGLDPLVGGRAGLVGRDLAGDGGSLAASVGVAFDDEFVAGGDEAVDGGLGQ